MTAVCPACVAGPSAIDIALPEEAGSIILSVPSLRCAACISAIEDHLGTLKGVSLARVNLTRKRVQVVTNLPVETLIERLSEIGYEAFPLDAKALGAQTDQAGQDLLLRLGVSGFAMMNVMLLSVAVWSGAAGATRDLFHLISATIALPTVLYAAQPFFQNALRSLRVARLNMDVPISLAILLATFISLYETLQGGKHAYFDAALSLTFFLLIGRYLEHHTRSAARSAAKELAALEVHTAMRKVGAKLTSVPIDALARGDVVQVATGMRVPVDGHLMSAEAHTDRSFLTGESEPVSHINGAALNAGEINLGAPFEMFVEAVGQDTRLHQIAQLVDTAENARNRYTSLADRAAKAYAPAVHLLALLTFLGWYAVSQDLRHSLNVAIAVLIITCPCALGLAVPAVSTAAISRLYKLGFLVKSVTALERLAEVKTVVLDKTGTLTKPGFTFDRDALSSFELAAAKALAQTSTHPLSKALSAHLSDVEPLELADVIEEKGRGLRAVAVGVPVALGQAGWLGGEGQGFSLRVGDALYPLAYSETLMVGTQDMAVGLRDQGYALEIISGDTVEKTSALAQSVGVAQFEAGMSPEAKSDHIDALYAQDQRPCMVGDGLNDTVALARAHASIAPGSALDAARNAADVVVIGNTLEHLPKLMEVSRQAVRLSLQNFMLATVYNLVAIPLAVLGYATPLAAALSMSISSITVLLNAMRIGRSK